MAEFRTLLFRQTCMGTGQSKRKYDHGMLLPAQRNQFLQCAIGPDAGQVR